ncbi:anthranilate synthase component II [Marinitoga litoralis]|uniref:anthranilate synthase component II n=1 Tax=Marinitoga litoralis TaxID=570855 RepID=UPI001961C54F|nr:aminodeoxychorismate/anthranilate synthase component II [Marinitoga litoralis]MBM7558621.1 anthranilate synthase/aminodeoxychorismate synthase-like glutamine amidotransferase [Marinitoga litoralis]
MILMIDNYDSFTYNLVHYLNLLNEEVLVYRNDKITIEEIEKLNPDMIVISPGPKTPNEAGISLEIIKVFKEKIPIFGVCLGHQTIAQSFGAKVIKAKEPVHGKVYPIKHNSKGVFKGLKNPLNVTRYHSLVVSKEDLPEDLEITAESLEGEIMAIKHKKYPIESVQFHPEAVLTEHGLDMLKNFLSFAKMYRKEII